MIDIYLQIEEIINQRQSYLLKNTNKSLWRVRLTRTKNEILTCKLQHRINFV